MSFFPTYEYKDELIKTANAMVADGKGILAADESTGTIGKRFAGINVANERPNRRAYRKLLFTSKGIEKSIAGVILFEETLFERVDGDDAGPDLVQYLKDAGVILGIKVDKGVKPMPSTDGEVYTQGLTDLPDRVARYYKQGARFAKWRAVINIKEGYPGLPSPRHIQETAWTLARYACICQAGGLVPIVEPEILMDGDHSIETCKYWTEVVLHAVFKALADQHALLEGLILKPNMVIAGTKNKAKKDPEQVARLTVESLQRAVPAAVPGIVFLSGGQTEDEATEHLRLMNSLPSTPRPWKLSFSYGRALQASCLAAWKGDAANTEAAQKAFLARAEANRNAALGKK